MERRSREDEQDKDLEMAVRLLRVFKEDNLLEQTLRSDENAALEVFFLSDMKCPKGRVTALILLSFDRSLSALTRGEATVMDDGLRCFLQRPEVWKPKLLQAILEHFELLPLNWGGGVVQLRGPPLPQFNPSDFHIDELRELHTATALSPSICDERE